MITEVEAKRLVAEIIATLVNIKRTMADLILQPAGAPNDAFQPVLYQRDEVTGRPLTKRQMAPHLILAIERQPDCLGILRRIIEIAAGWSSVHLAQDEDAARATVQKARELLGQIETMEAREAKQRELARKEEIARMEQQRAEMIRVNSELLLRMFDDLAVSTDFQRRGYLLQDLLNRVFDLHQIPVNNSFTRNQGGEQIDGAFNMVGWFYIVECRWRQRLADIRQLDGLMGQVDRSGKQTMGLFLSIEGWSRHVPELLKQNPNKAILLMDGYDLRATLDAQADLHDFLIAKVAHLNLNSEPHLSVKEYLADAQA